MKRVAISGPGRIGRMVLRHYMEMRPKDIELVAANDLVPSDDLAHLLKLAHKPAKKEIRGRAPAVSLIPATTGSDTATTMVLPELNGRPRALTIIRQTTTADINGFETGRSSDNILKSEEVVWPTGKEKTP